MAKRFSHLSAAVTWKRKPGWVALKDTKATSELSGKRHDPPDPEANPEAVLYSTVQMHSTQPEDSREHPEIQVLLRFPLPFRFSPSLLCLARHRSSRQSRRLVAGDTSNTISPWPERQERVCKGARYSQVDLTLHGKCVFLRKLHSN
jgi:hypothetical protein